MVNKDGHGKIDCNLGKRPIPFIALFIEKSTCRFSSTCFWPEASLTSRLLEKSDGWVTDLVFPGNKSCCGYLYLSGLNDMVYPVSYDHQVIIEDNAIICFRSFDYISKFEKSIAKKMHLSESFKTEMK